MPRLRPLGTLLVLLAVTASTRGARIAAATERDQESGFTMSLQPDNELSGWTLLGGQVTTEPNQLNLTAGVTLVRSAHAYHNCLLEFEYQVSGSGSGPCVYFHGQLNDSKSDYSGTGIQVDRPLVYRCTTRRFLGRRRYTAYQSTDWNQLRMQIQDGRLAVHINDQLSYQAALPSSVDGLMALHMPSSQSGSIAIRNLRMTELDHQSLFNGRDLTGWEGQGADATSCWEVRAGRLRCTGQKGTWLRSQEEFSDFNLRLEYRLQEGGNSGVYVRVPPDGRHHGEGAGIEVQILDDAADRYAELKPYQFSASLYAIAPVTKRVARPAGQWNTLEINCHGTSYQVIHNGIKVVDVTERDYPELTERLTAGFLGLQNHNQPVAFRHLRIQGSATP